MARLGELDRIRGVLRSVSFAERGAAVSTRTPSSVKAEMLSWGFCCLPKESGGLGLLSTQKKGIALFSKRIIRFLTGDEAHKVLV